MTAIQIPCQRCGARALPPLYAELPLAGHLETIGPFCSLRCAEIAAGRLQRTVAAPATETVPSDDLLRLKAAVDAGYYKTEDAPESEKTLIPYENRAGVIVPLRSGGDWMRERVAEQWARSHEAHPE